MHFDGTQLPARITVSLLPTRSILDQFQIMLSKLVTQTQKHGEIASRLEKYRSYPLKMCGAPVSFALQTSTLNQLKVKHTVRLSSAPIGRLTLETVENTLHVYFCFQINVNVGKPNRY